MIQRILKKIFGGKAPIVIPDDAHPILPKNISDHAADIVQKLQDNGYIAYIVGGAVRDILLGFQPKDFDIATDAEPDDIRALFGRNSRRIGRRFPIVHVYRPRNRHTRNRFREFIEVSTFRAKEDAVSGAPRYGTPREDAHRRDFTINGIFYDPVSREIHDYVGGCADIAAKKIRMIGVANRRLPEDPVRILRALRLSTKLGLRMSDKLQKELARHAATLTDIPPARLLDEMIKVINSGAGARIFAQWQQFDICTHILPILEGDNPLFFSAMAENDRRIAEHRETSVSYIIAALFWQHTAQRWHHHRAAGVASVQAMEQAVIETPFHKNRIVSHRLTGIAKDIFFLQAQMEYTPTERRVNGIMAKPMFDRALAFAAMRQDHGAAQTASWWSQFTRGNQTERQRMLAAAPKTRRRKKSPPLPAATPPPDAPQAPPQPDPE